jgi:hypothetical protein
MDKNEKIKILMSGYLELYDLLGYDYKTMPEHLREKSFQMTLNIINKILDNRELDFNKIKYESHSRFTY